MFRRIRIRAGSAKFIRINTIPVVEQYAIFNGGAMRYGSSTMYHGFLCGSA